MLLRHQQEVVGFALTKCRAALIEAAAIHGMNDVMMSRDNANNGPTWRADQARSGVQLRKFNDDIYDAFGEASEEVFEGASDAQQARQEASTTVSPRRASRSAAG